MIENTKKLLLILSLFILVLPFTFGTTQIFNFNETFDNVDDFNLNVNSPIPYQQDVSQLNCGLTFTGGDIGNWCISYFNVSFVSGTVQPSWINLSSFLSGYGKSVLIQNPQLTGQPKSYIVIFHDFGSTYTLNGSSILSGLVKANQSFYDANNYGRIPFYVFVDDNLNCVALGYNDNVHPFQDWCNNLTNVNISLTGKQVDTNIHTFYKTLSVELNNTEVNFRYLMVGLVHIGLSSEGGYVDNIALSNVIQTTNATNVTSNNNMYFNFSVVPNTRIRFNDDNSGACNTSKYTTINTTKVLNLSTFTMSNLEYFMDNSSNIFNDHKIRGFSCFVTPDALGNYNLLSSSEWNYNAFCQLSETGTFSGANGIVCPVGTDVFKSGFFYSYKIPTGFTTYKSEIDILLNDTYVTASNGNLTIDFNVSQMQNQTIRFYYDDLFQKALTNGESYTGSFLFNRVLLESTISGGGYHWDIANGFYISVSNVLSPSQASVLFNETFDVAFGLNPSDCYTNANGMTYASYNGWSPKITTVNGNQWACWKNTTSGQNFQWVSSSDSSHIVTPYGLEHTSSSTQKSVTSLTTSVFNMNLELLPDDVISFVCSSPTTNYSYQYLMVGEHDVDTTGFYTGIVSLKNGGCAYNNSLGYGSDIACCELKTITGGTDCVGTKQTINFTEQDIDNNCFDEGLSDLQFSSIDRFDLFNLKLSAVSDLWYFDNLFISRPTLVNNNTLPFLITFNAIPNPAEPLENVTWYWMVGDNDNNASQIYTHFSCNSDSTFEYIWALRGNSGSFNCVYPTIGTKTATLEYTDESHFLTAWQTSTAQVVIANPTVSPTPTQGGSCTGYIAQSCTGTCSFVDNFNYDKMISCAGWSGSASIFHPTSNIMSVFGTTIYQSEYELDKGTSGSLKSSQIASYQTEFDLKIKTSDVLNFQIYNDEINKNALILQVNNYNLVAYKDTGSLTLGSLTPNTWYNIRAVVNYGTNQIYYYLDDVFVGTIDIYESGVTSSRKWIFAWSNTNIQFDIDNFALNIVNYSANYTNVTVAPPINYVYNGNLFCAINWTSNSTRKFSMDNCAERGFPTAYPLYSLCLPRACIQDVGLLTLTWVTSNIFRTIIIVTAFILIAPLLVVLFKKK